MDLLQNASQRKVMADQLEKMHRERDVQWLPCGGLQLPHVGTISAFLLRSPSTGNLFLGSTGNMKRILDEHNSGLCSATRDIARDWAVVSYVHGFQRGHPDCPLLGLLQGNGMKHLV